MKEFLYKIPKFLEKVVGVCVIVLVVLCLLDKVHNISPEIIGAAVFFLCINVICVDIACSHAIVTVLKAIKEIQSSKASEE